MKNIRRYAVTQLLTDDYLIADWYNLRNADNNEAVLAIYDLFNITQDIRFSRLNVLTHRHLRQCLE